MLGINFEECKDMLFSVITEACDLSLASFTSLSLLNSSFSQCKFHETDFSGCDMSGLLLHSCDLTNAVFDQTNLEGADLRTSSHYSIDPELNRIRKAKFGIAGVIGLLTKYDITIE